MITFNATMSPRLAYRGNEKVTAVRDNHQRPKARDVGRKWKITYRDYSSGEAKHRSKVWSKSVARSVKRSASPMCSWTK